MTLLFCHARRISASVFYCSLLSFGLTLLTSTASASVKRIEVQGHRGARARYPENTLPAFEYALKVGVDVLEMDMAVTRDNVIVVSHDPHISALICADASGKAVQNGPLIHSLTLAEVKKFDCGALKNPKFPRQIPVPHTAIPSLEEVFSWVEASPLPAAKNVRFNIETKITEEHPEYTVDPETFVALFLATVKKHHMESRVMLQSFDFRTLAALNRQAPSIPQVALSDNKFANSVDIIQNTGAQTISPLWLFVNPRYVERLHAVGAKVVPWTVNTEKDWAYMLRSEVDAIITDDPEELIAYLKRKGLR